MSSSEDRRRRAAEVIRASRDVILNGFRDELLRLGLARPDRSDAEVFDHVPIMLEELAASFERVGPAPAGAADGGHEHGVDRWHQGWDFAAIARELGVLGKVVVRALAGAGLEVSAEEVGVVLDWLGASIARSSDAYVSERDARIAALLRDMEAERTWLRAVVEFLPIGLFLADPDGRLRQANEAARRLWGDAPLARTVAEYASYQGWRPDGTPLRAEDWGLVRALRGEASVDEEIEIRTFDGRRRTILNSATPIRDADGVLLGALASNVDITARKLEENRQRALVEIGKALTGTPDAHRSVQQAIDAIVRLVADCAVVDALAERSAALQPIAFAHASPVLVPDLLRLRSDQLLEGRADDVRQMLLRSREPLFVPALGFRDGSSRLASPLEPYRRLGLESIVIVPIEFGGEALGTLTLGQGPSGRAFDVEDRGFGAKVASRIGAALQLGRLWQRSQRALAAREEAIGTLSHDLRGPLHAISAGMALLRAQPADQPVERVALERTLDRIGRSVAHMSKLIEDLLDLSRMEAGHLALARSEVSARALLEQTRELHAPLAEQSGVRVDLDVDAEPRVICDPGRIGQVLANLLHNAIKFSPRGGVVTLRARASESGCELAVVDRGPGIPPEQMPKLFEEYWSGDPEHRGTGLGLVIARRIVEAHGSALEVESTPGRGATFRFVLPAAG